ncbi:MAG: PQQ-binding-like beta-propeller repeat protein [Planctomycetota bacterium]
MKRPMPSDGRHSRVRSGLGLLGLVLACSVTAGDWPLFRGDAGLTGVASDTLPEKLEPLWVFEAGDGFASAVAVSDGAVYAASLDGTLYVLDLDSGELRWKYEAGAAIKASPAVSDGLVFFGDEDGTFHAVDLDTQQLKWSFEAEGQVKLGGGPAVRGDVVEYPIAFTSLREK